MFEVGFTEILLIFGLALLVLGPEKLPGLARTLGRWTGRARSMARQLRNQLEHEVTLEELTKSNAARKPEPYAPPSEDSPASDGTPDAAVHASDPGSAAADDSHMVHDVGTTDDSDGGAADMVHSAEAAHSAESPSPGTVSPGTVHDAPVHDAPVHDTPVHDAPVHDAPVHDAPVHDAPVHDTPVHDTPVHDTPVHRDGAAHETPVQGRKTGESQDAATHDRVGSASQVNPGRGASAEDPRQAIAGIAPDSEGLEPATRQPAAPDPAKAEP